MAFETDSVDHERRKVDNNNGKNSNNKHELLRSNSKKLPKSKNQARKTTIDLNSFTSNEVDLDQEQPFRDTTDLDEKNKNKEENILYNENSSKRKQSVSLKSINKLETQIFNKTRFDNNTDNTLINAQQKQDKMRLIKEEWIKQEMQARQEEFTEHESIKVFVGSWNVNGKTTQEDLGLWFKLKDVDLFVIGIQEFDLSAEAFIINDGLKETEWTEKIEKDMKEKKHEFYKVASRQLVGLFMIVYANKKHYSYIKQATTDSVGCGIMGLMGNKGAVAARFKFKDSYLCFVNSHLAANLNMVDRRNQDYNEICRRIGFPIEETYESLSTFYRTRESFYGNNNGMYSVFDYQRSKKNVFIDFEEGTINFNPTYKYDIGTNNYDTSEKQRCPSWCDRILWRSRDKNNKIKLVEYDSVNKLTSSDHKPIYAIMDVDIKGLLPDKYSSVYSEVVRELDKFENESMPDASISSSYIDFGELTYNTQKHQELVITNIGKHYLQFEFVPKLNELEICKPWIWIDPINGERATIRLVAHVDNKSSESLNLKLEKPEDILVLHLVNGKDYFISVSAKYIPTLFGINLENLARLPKMPIVSTKNVNLLPLENMHSVPRPVWRMPDLFLSPADPSLVEHIKKCLDKDLDFDNDLLLVSSLDDNNISTTLEDNSTNADDTTKYGGIYAMCETLIEFLESLPEPVIPSEFYEQCLKAAAINKEACIDVLENMSRTHINTFLYLTSFIREIISWSARPDDMVKIEKLAVVLSSVLLRNPPNSNLQHTSEKNVIESIVELKKRLILFFVVDDAGQLEIDVANTA